MHCLVQLAVQTLPDEVAMFFKKKKKLHLCHRVTVSELQLIDDSRNVRAAEVFDRL